MRRSFFCEESMAWSSGRRNSCPKQRLSDDTDSSSEDEPPFMPNLLKNCSLQNTACSQSSCTNHLVVATSSTKNKAPIAERLISEASSNINSPGCSSFCGSMALCGNAPNTSMLSSSVKRSNLPNPMGNSSHSLSLSLPPASNSRISKSLNIAPVNAHSSRTNNNSLGIDMHNNANISSNVVGDASGSLSSSAKLVLLENNISIQNNDGQKVVSGELSSNSDSNIARIGNTDSSAGVQLKYDKVLNVQQNNSTSGHSGNSGPLYNWQATMTTVKERFAFLFNNEILSDIHFLVGKGELCQRIPAHKFVLAVGSAVFDAMFYGKLCTRQEEIELPDVEPQAFLSLLRFLYSDEVQIGPETVMTVLYTAKKYAVPSLERHCVEYLKVNLSPDNAFMLLTQARLFDEPQLASLCLDTIDKSTFDALSADGFTDIDHDTLCSVLQRDTLRIREAKLFQAVVRWSEARCTWDGVHSMGSHQRATLGRALSLVRFPLMTIEEFAQGPAQSDILTDREVVQLFLYFTVNPKPPVNFLDIPRCCMTGKEQTVCRFQQIESRWGYSGTSDRIRFIVDRRIFVVGFGMYGSIHGTSEYEVTIQIIHTGTGKVCISNDTSFVSDGSVNTFRVMFKEPFEVLPNTNYTAYATLKGTDSHYGTKGVRKISVECPSGDRVTFQFTYAAGNNNGTSVEDGQIPEIIFYT